MKARSVPSNSERISCAKIFFSVAGTERWQEFKPLFGGGKDPDALPHLIEDVTRSCEISRDLATTVGGWTRPTSGSRATGCIYTGL
jgi:hypothetical protein